MDEPSYRCPQCGQETVFTPITLDTDEVIWCMNWTCKNCGKDLVWFVPIEEDKSDA